MGKKKIRERRLPMYNKDDILKRLKEERLRLGLSQREMSNFIRLSQSDYSKVELGKRLLSYYELLNLCASDADVNYIFTGRRSSDKYTEFFGKYDYYMLVNCFQIIFATVNLCSQRTVCVNKKALAEQTRYVPFASIGSQDSKDRTRYIFLALRSSKQWQQAKMAEELGMDIKKLRDLEKGKKQPDIEIIYRMYQKFGILPAVMLQDRKGLLSEVSIILDQMEKECCGHFLDFFTFFGNA